MTPINKQQISDLNLQVFINSPAGETEVHKDPATGEETTRLKWKRVRFPEEVDTAKGLVKMWVPSSLPETDLLAKVEVDPAQMPEPPKEIETEASLRIATGNVTVTTAEGELLQVTNPDVL